MEALSSILLLGVNIISGKSTELVYAFPTDYSVQKVNDTIKMCSLD